MCICSMMTSPPGFCDSDPVPETATRSRERRRVALVIREITACFQEFFDRLEAKLDMATNGLVLVANQELAKLNSADTKPEGDQSTSIPSPQHHDVCEKHGMDHKALSLDMTDNNKFCHTGMQTDANWEPLPLDNIHIIIKHDGTNPVHASTWNTHFAQPEVEQSPEKNKAFTSDSDHTIPPECLHFDIHSEPDVMKDNLTVADKLDALLEE